MKKKREDILRTMVLGCLAFLCFLPLAETIFNSFVWEEKISLEQYRSILMEQPTYLSKFWNSVKLTVPCVAGNILISLLGAYAFSVMRFKGKDLLFLVYIVLMLLPTQVTLMPNYMVASQLGIEDSYLAIILPAIFNPFGVFLLRQQIRLIPLECMEAARIDGAGHWQIFRYLIVPMARSGIAAVAMLLVIEFWNLIDQAIVFIKQEDAYPLSIFLAKMVREASDISYAGSTYYLIPIIGILCFGHGYLRQGIGLMNVKGR